MNENDWRSVNQWNPNENEERMEWRNVEKILYLKGYMNEKKVLFFSTHLTDYC